MTLKDVRKMVETEVDQAGSYRRAAKRLEVSHAYLADVVSGHREPGPKMLTALGVEKITTTRVTYKLRGVRI